MALLKTKNAIGALALAGTVLCCGCRFLGGGGSPAPVPPMIGAASPAEGAKVVKRQKIRFATEIANSVEQKAASKTPNADFEHIEELRTPRPQATMVAAHEEQSATPPGPPYPIAARQESTAAPLPQFAATQRLPEVRQVSYGEQPLY